MVSIYWYSIIPKLRSTPSNVTVVTEVQKFWQSLSRRPEFWNEAGVDEEDSRMEWERVNIHGEKNTH
jgi:hypothetical protein